MSRTVSDEDVFWAKHQRQVYGASAVFAAGGIALIAVGATKWNKKRSGDNSMDQYNLLVGDTLRIASTHVAPTDGFVGPTTYIARTPVTLSTETPSGTVTLSGSALTWSTQQPAQAAVFRVTAVTPNSSLGAWFRGMDAKQTGGQVGLGAPAYTLELYEDPIDMGGVKYEPSMEWGVASFNQAIAPDGLVLPWTGLLTTQQDGDAFVVDSPASSYSFTSPILFKYSLDSTAAQSVLACGPDDPPPGSLIQGQLVPSTLLFSGGATNALPPIAMAQGNGPPPSLMSVPFISYFQVLKEGSIPAPMTPAPPVPAALPLPQGKYAPPISTAGKLTSLDAGIASSTTTSTRAVVPPDVNSQPGNQVHTTTAEALTFTGVAVFLLSIAFAVGVAMAVRKTRSRQRSTPPPP